ncbi:hypothetical protein RI367_001962 [Sorochytrium milnesiophthora]
MHANNANTADLRALLARLPPELLPHILAFAGIEAVIATRQLVALRRLLDAYKRGTNRSTRIEAGVGEACIKARWSAGLQLLLDYGLSGITEQSVRLPWCLDGICLRADTVDRITRHRGGRYTPSAARLTYNLLASGADVWQMAQQHCQWSSAFAEALACEVIRRGGGVDRLRWLWQQCGMYESDWHLARTFITAAAEHSNLGLLQALDDAYPELVSEGALHVDVASTASLAVVQFLYGRARSKEPAYAVQMAMDRPAFDTVLWLLDQHAPGDPKVHVDAAKVAQGGCLPLLQRLWHEQTGVQGRISELARSAAQGNHVHVLDWLYSVDPHSFSAAAFSSDSFHDRLGQADGATVEWLQTHAGFAPTTRTLAAVCRAGQPDFAKWLWTAYPAIRSLETVVQAVRAGDVDLAQWMFDRLDAGDQHAGLRWHDIAQPAAAGYERAIRWLYDRSPFHGTEMNLRSAVRGGNLDLAKWLYSLNPGAMVAQDHLKVAAGQPNLAMVQWVASLLPAGASPHEALTAAALSGLLDTVRWLDQQSSARYTTEAMLEAAGQGHLDVMRYLHERQVEGWTAEVMDRAAAHGRLDVVVWLHEHRQEGCTTDAMDHAAANNHLHVVRWLHENRSEGCTTEAMDRAAENGNVSVVRFLHANRSEGCTTRAMDCAAAGAYIDLVRLFHTSRSEGCTPFAMRQAARYGYLSIVQFLHENGYEGCARAEVNDAPPYVREWFDEHRP